MSLRRSLSIALAILAGLAFVAAVSLSALTSYLHRTTSQVTAAHDSIRLAQEMEVDVLAHARTSGRLDRTIIEARVRDDLKRMERYVESDEERAAFVRAGKNIDNYFQNGLPVQGTDDLPQLETTFDSLRELVDINVGQADGVDADAAHWDNIADGVGLGVAILLIVGISAILTWLWMFAFRPVLDICNAMRSFATGRRTSRAPLSGPAELRSIAGQFNEMADALERQYENQLAFLAGVAHDLRNPISTLRMSTHLIPPNEPLPEEERLRMVLTIVSRQVAGLDRMVGDLLDASRIEAGQLELRIVDTDARMIAQEVFELFEAGPTGHQLQFQMPKRSLPVRCDPMRIEQVLTNLVSNAIKYSPDGAPVEMTIENRKHAVVFRVADKGMGIPSEEIPFIFEPFRRSSRSKGKVAGVGLGLSVSRRIVEAHHGRIEVESHGGEGTTFQVSLPEWTISS